jgi:hypothetical protein
MRNLQIASSVVATFLVAAFVASCSSDTVANDSLSAPDDPAFAASKSISGGGWSPAVEAASNDKVAVCHSGNGKHFTQLNLPAQAARAHLGDPNTGHGGHSGDFRVSISTSCPPSSTPGHVQVCKVAGTGITAGTNFTFTLTANGQPKTVTVAAGAAPAGTCVSGGDYGVGTMVELRETAQTGVNTSSIVVSPAGAQQGTSDLPGRLATIVVGSGMTTVTFTNTNAAPPVTGTLVICKIGGTGITAGTNFSFTAGAQTATIAAGAAPNGTCGSALTLPVGAVTVTETAVTGTSVQSIAGTPSPTNINLSTRSATAQINAGQETRITFTNVAP